MKRDSTGLPQISVRPFENADIPELIRLMRGLAELEHYLDAFAVTGEEIEARGLCSIPEFLALVAEVAGMPGLSAMAVLYVIPYTFTLKPNLVLKEMYVDERARGIGIGSALFEATKEVARDLECQQIMWTVMTGNSRAEAFYKKHGGRPDSKWQGWVYEI